MRTLDVQCRAAMEGKRLAGYAAVFNQETNLGGIWERIAPGAFDQALARDDVDVVALVQHDWSMVLGRMKSGTLRVTPDSKGLAFEVDLPNTSYANDLRELVARGDISQASFAFTYDTYNKLERADGSTLIEVTSVGRLFDVSAVTVPAYQGTSVGLRKQPSGGPSGRSQLVKARAGLLRRS